MRKKRIAAFLLALILLASVTTALAATAGSADDPLISLSYVTDSYLPAMLDKIQAAVRAAFIPAREQLLQEGDRFAPWLLPSDGSVHLGTGGSLILLSGAATLRIDGGAAVDVTNGAEAASGALSKNVRILGAENCDALVTVGTGAVVAVAGDAQVTGGSLAANPFTDVRYANWYYVDVTAAYTRDLIAGMTATSYEPDGQLTVAQAIKLAACLNERYYDDKVTLQNAASGPWYQTYVDYALAAGILSQEPNAEEMNAPIDRARFVALFYRALPATEYSIKNSVPAGTIPDVSGADSHAAEIYAFYRAGILTGSDAAGTFQPGSDIRRSEVAAILTRMYDAGARQTVSLG